MASSIHADTNDAQTMPNPFNSSRSPSSCKETNRKQQFILFLQEIRMYAWMTTRSSMTSPLDGEAALFALALENPKPNAKPFSRQFMVTIALFAPLEALRVAHEQPASLLGKIDVKMPS
jgi:hypothetical protein